jgi:hypothetical protein
MIKYFLLFFGLFFISCENSKPLENIKKNELEQQEIFSKSIKNRVAYIPPQCYTDIKSKNNNNFKYNPCYACHTKGKTPNYIDDSDLQDKYIFITDARENHWTNLFKDRTKLINKISSEEIKNYIRQDNYTALKSNLQNLKHKSWDFNKNGKWDGYIPDCNFNFDKDGFDRDKNQNYTGWRAFAYYPFLGTFFPTNGSTDDVIIRLPKEFQTDKNSSEFNLDIYKTNLNILEKVIKNSSKNQNLKYVGKAENIKIHNGLFPKGTEFLHTVRYIDFDENQNLKLSKRMKEVRYSKKISYLSPSNWQIYVIGLNRELLEDNDDPKKIVGNFETGMSNGLGWIYSGFIEDNNGELRPQSNEETMFCIGCHSSIGATTDTTFAFNRKLTDSKYISNWFHWNQKSGALKNISDNNLEYSKYLEKNPFGDEFRENREVFDKFFEQNLSKKTKAFNILKNDISFLLQPTKARAEILNKTYKTIVEEQSYIYGRDATIKPAKNVLKNIQ